MPSITYDGQSFIIDGRRIWLVSGAIHYTRTPHQLWRDRIRAAKQAGLNCIETYVFWNAHEPQPGRYRFDGDLDLRAFIRLIADEGMYCILRPGPYVCAEWDFGGLPAWLGREKNVALRQSNPLFLQHVARYLDAVMQQVRDLQITQPEGGPILLIQNENEWFCHNDDEGRAYLEELSRYLREGGCTVPIINCNNLWQHVPGTIDCWNGWANMLRDLRQLRLAQPDAPRLVTELWPGWFDSWGREHQRTKSPQHVLQRLAEVSATGSQFNLYMFHGGTNFGFTGGRTVGAPDQYMITSYDYDAPLTEAGGRGQKYLAVKRICTFLSQFANVMAHLRPDVHPATLIPSHGKPAVIHQSGSQGDVVFIIRDQPAKPDAVQLLTPAGQTFTVHLGHDAAAWVALNVNLNGKATLDFSNLRPYALLDNQLLVLFGPAGSEALVSINGAILQQTVPAGSTPLLCEHEHVHLAILNDAQLDSAYITADNTLIVGCAGLNADDQPIRGANASCSRIKSDGSVKQHRFQPAAKKSTAPKLAAWQHADLTPFIDGSAPRFAAINGPLPLENCGADLGYGWYRLAMKSASAKKVNLLLPGANDRLHLYHHGKLIDILGFGPAASDQPIPLNLPKGDTDLVFLADNLGRLNYGTNLGESKGIFAPPFHVTPLQLPKPLITHEPRIDPFALPFPGADRAYIPHCRKGDRSHRSRITFNLKLTGKQPLVLFLRHDRPRSVILINNHPLAIDGGQLLTERFIIPANLLKKGANSLTLAVLDSSPPHYDIRKCLALYQADELTVSSWFYARWQMPENDQFKKTSKQPHAAPCWYRTTFSVKSTDTPLWFEPRSLTKGQLYLNGRNVGRYFVATPAGKRVPPQSLYYLPEPWLNTHAENELVLFDEHGKSPASSKLTYDELAPFGDWP
ncbi:MAG: glycoside hydrolase family 35 protein [Phycisphaerales bacterium]